MTLNLLATSIYSKLSGDSTLTSMLATTTSIYSIRAPEDAVYPYIVYSLFYGGVLNINPSDLREPSYFIRAYATTAKVAGNIQTQIATLLHKGTITVTGYTLIASELTEELEGDEITDAGRSIYMRGGVYRFQLDS